MIYTEDTSSFCFFSIFLRGMARLFTRCEQCTKGYGDYRYDASGLGWFVNVPVSMLFDALYSYQSIRSNYMTSFIQKFILPKEVDFNAALVEHSVVINSIVTAL